MDGNDWENKAPIFSITEYATGKYQAIEVDDGHFREWWRRSLGRTRLLPQVFLHTGYFLLYVDGVISNARREKVSA
jgi:hypothetical protein